MAQMDDRLLWALRGIKDGTWVYGVSDRSCMDRVLLLTGMLL